MCADVGIPIAGGHSIDTVEPIYGLVALGFHITYAVSGTVNFAQGSSMMLGAVFAYAFAVGLGWPLPLAAAMAHVGGWRFAFSDAGAPPALLLSAPPA